MTLDKRLDDVLDTRSKVKIIRLFISRREDFMAGGREIARLTGITPPAAHTALKELHDQDILKREILGKQHIYRMNFASHTVKFILKPAFRKELLVKEDIKNFLLKKIREYRITRLVKSIILYGSLQSGSAQGQSDCDIAVITIDNASKKKVEEVFTDAISREFSEYFGISLDPYIKTKDEFNARFKKRLPPVSTLMKSYAVIYGKDPISQR